MERTAIAIRLARVLMPQRLRFALYMLFRQMHAKRRRRRPLAAAATFVGIRQLALARRRRAVGIDRLDAVYVINLERRPERMASVQSELDRLGIDAHRFEAVDHSVGRLGCTLSHIACMQTLLEEGWNAMLVCEDDLRFEAGRKEVDLLVDRFLDDPRAEVACLACIPFDLEAHSALFLRSRRSLTTAGYVVKRSIAQDLVAAWERGAAALALEDDGRHNVDVAWGELQRERMFLIPIRRAAVQESGYSDLERRVTSYPDWA